MSDDATPPKSPGGSTIYRHGDPAPWRHPVGESCLEHISAHIEQYLGPIESVLHEIVSDHVHIDVHVVRPTAASPCWRLVTSGMSDLPMTTPEDADVPRFAELMVTLPPDWKLDQASMDDEGWYWPVRLLKVLARLPHLHGTWLGWGHTVPHGDPPEPFAPTTRLAGAIVLPSVSVPEGFHQLVIDDTKQIWFYAMVPLYESEMNFKLKEGAEALLKRFGRHHVDDIVSPERNDVTRKKWGLF